MANEKKVITIDGEVCSRPRERTIPQDRTDDKPLIGLAFEVMEEREQRTNRDGQDYNADPTWALQAMNFEDEESKALYTKVSDLRIGDPVRVQCKVVTKMRRGFHVPQLQMFDLEVLPRS